MEKRELNKVITKNILTTGDIARYCETSVKQVNRWIYRDELTAFQNPGGHYRITKKDFREFLERFGMPVREEFFRSERKKTILIADDDADLANGICDMLQNRYRDFQIEAVHDGYEALITVGNINPDLLILDIRMPKIDGLEVCRRIRNNKVISTHIKILAITGHSDAYDRKTVLAAGADEYLLKPLDRDVLLTNVEQLL